MLMGVSASPEVNMDWNEILQWSRMAFIGCCALVVQLTLTLAVQVLGQQAVHVPAR